MTKVPEVQYSTRMGLPAGVVWDFVKDMNNWAPFLTGYQAHEVLSDRESIWTLKGDVGVLARTVRLRVEVTEWNGPDRVAFRLTGLNEPVEGGGSMVMSPDSAAPSMSPDSVAPSKTTEPGPSRGLVRRFVAYLFRVLYRMRHGAPQALPSPRAGGGPATLLTFTLRMEAGGPTGPLVNALLEPAMAPAAEGLAKRIAVHLERGKA